MFWIVKNVTSTAAFVARDKKAGLVKVGLVNEVKQSTPSSLCIQILSLGWVGWWAGLLTRWMIFITYFLELA